MHLPVVPLTCLLIAGCIATACAPDDVRPDDDVDSGADGGAREGEGEGRVGEGEGEGEGEGSVVAEGEGEGSVVAEGEGEGSVGEGEGEGAVVSDVVVVNEVGCATTDFVEIVNVGTGPLDLARVTIARATTTIPFGSGTIAPGAHAVFSPAASGFGYACGVEKVKLAIDGVALPPVPLPLLPRNASFARIPDVTGSFVRGTPTPGAGNSAWVDEAARLFDDLDEPVPTTLPRIDITLPLASETALRSVPDQFVTASFQLHDAVGTTTTQTIGVRIKGQSVLRTLDDKAAFKLDFNRFAPGGHLFGLDKLTLNNLVQDGSASRERVLTGLYRRAGIPTVRAGYVDVFVNGVRFGVYLAQEALNDDDLLGREFASTQAMYEGQYGMDLYVGNEQQLDEDFGTDPTRAALVNVTTTLGNANGATLLQETASVIDWDEVLADMAADVFCGHWDSYTATRNNFTFHLDDAGRLSLLSAGADQAFCAGCPDGGVCQQVCAPAVGYARYRAGGGLLLTRCLEDTVCAAQLDVEVAHVRDVARAWLDGGGRARLTSDAQRLVAHFTNDTRREWNVDALPGEVDAIIQLLDARIAEAVPH